MQKIGWLQQWVEEYAFSWCLLGRQGLLKSLLACSLSGAGIYYALQHTQGYQERKLLLVWVKFIVVPLKHQKARFPWFMLEKSRSHKRCCLLILLLCRREETIWIILISFGFCLQRCKAHDAMCCYQYNGVLDGEQVRHKAWIGSTQNYRWHRSYLPATENEAVCHLLDCSPPFYLGKIGGK